MMFKIELSEENWVIHHCAWPFNAPRNIVLLKSNIYTELILKEQYKGRQDNQCVKSIISRRGWTWCMWKIGGIFPLLRYYFFKVIKWNEKKTISYYGNNSEIKYHNRRKTQHRYPNIKSDSTRHFFRNTCTKTGLLRSTSIP